MSEGFNVTPVMLRQWAAEQEKLRQQLAAVQRNLDEVTQKLALATSLEALISPKAESPAQKETFELTPPPTKKNGHEQISAQNMTDAVEQVANQSPLPLTKNQLRDVLGAMGFGEPGPYFYTVIMRLKARKKITVHPDGRIWKAA